MKYPRSLRHSLALLWIALAAACGDRAGGSAPARETASATVPEPSLRRPGNNGPGLRRTAGDLLQLPVPRAFDLSHVEAVHFAAGLGRNPSRIFEFVRDQIAFEPYVGCLRGPRGTLMAMAGNSVDRAALLADLLQRSGFRVRFMHGTLPDALAAQLVASIWEEHRPGLAPDPSGASEFNPVKEKLIADIKRDAALIQASLTSANLSTTAGSFVAKESLQEETQDHYWVEWWKDGAWTTMDPSFADAVPGQAYAKGEAVGDVLPEALFHRVEIRVRVEEYAAGRATHRDVLRYAAKAPDLSGADLVLAHQATVAGRQGPSEVKPFLVVGQKQIPGSVFSVKPADANATGGVLDAFGGGPEESPLATAESVELEFVAPGGRRDLIVREIFDRIGRGRRATGEAVNAERLASAATADLTAGIYDFFFTTGAIDPWHLSNLAAPTEDAEDSIDVGAGLRRINTVFCAMSDRLTTRLAGANGPILRSYLDSPRVQVSEWVPQEGALRISLDLRRDTARVVTSGYTSDLSVRAQVLRGVVSGQLERIVIERFTRARDGRELAVKPVVSTSSLFERARAGQVPFVLFTRDRAELGPDWPANARPRIAETIAAGQWIVAPQHPIDVDGSPRLAWWQVDPASGTTIGVTDEGLHGAQVEAAIVRMDGRGYSIAFKVNGRFISTGGRLFNFASRAQAENFVTQLGSRLTSMGDTFSWFYL